MNKIELILLGDMFNLEPEAQRTAIKDIHPDDFITDKAKMFFQAMFEIVSEGNVVDILLLYDKLKTKGIAVNDKDLLQITHNPDSLGINYKAHLFSLQQEKSKQSFKQLINKIKRSIDKASYEELQQLKEELSQELSTTSKFNLLSCSVDNYIDDYYKTLGKGKNELLGIDTGFTELNKLIHGLRGLIILAGVPKTGKTSYVLQLSFQAAQRGTPVLFYSLEMSRQQLVTRILSRLSKIAYTDILLKAGAYFLKKEETNFAKLFTKEQLDDLIIAEETRKKMNNYYIRTLEDSGKIDFINIENEIELIKQKHNCNALVIVDHLQVFPYENYRDQIDKEQNLITKFNEIQKKTNSTILLISQKNKDAFRTKNGNSATELAGVKGSVDLVYLASLILTLNDSKEENSNPNIKLLELNIISRDTKSGSIGLEFNGEIHSFTERSPES